MVPRKLVLLSLLLFATTAFGATKTWTGAVSTLWSVGGNWSDGLPPANGDVLVFPFGAANTNMVNDLVGLTVTSMSFPNASGNYGVNGNAFIINAGVDNRGSLGWNLPTTLGASQTFVAGHITRFFNTIALNGNTLTLVPSITTFFAGSSITGTGDVIMRSGGGTQLSGSINITGTLSLTEGADLNVEGTISATSMTAASGSIVSGAGTVPAFTSNGATIRPGHDAGEGCCETNDPHMNGILTSGSFSANGGVLSIDLVTAVPGTGHDQLAVNGSVTLNNPTLAISFPTVVPPAGSSFVILANDGVEPVSGAFAGLPEGATFAVGLSTLQITYTGGTGNDAAVTVLSAPKAWTGAVSNLWSVGGNWNDGVAPVNGDVLVFPQGAANTNTFNDLVGLTVTSINVTGSIANYGLNANAITITSGVVNAGSLGVDLPITLGASQAFSAGHITRLFNTIALNGHTLTLHPSITTFFAGSSITGTGNVIMKSGGGTQLSGSINITGTLSLTEGADLNVAGTISAASMTVASGSIVSGAGTVPAFTSTGATIRPGNDAGEGCCETNDTHVRGILTTGNLSLTGGVLSIDLVTPVPGTGHDQLAVNGTVTLSNPTLTVSFPVAAPAAGTSFVIIANDGTDPVSGIFAGRPEGAAFTVGSTALRITYAGGTGNDVVLTALHATATTIASSKNPTVAGEPFTLTAQVTSSAGVPTGTVSFEEGATVLGTAPLDAGGQATLNLTLPAGAHSIVARYLGDGAFDTSVSAPLTQNVNSSNVAGVPTLNTWMLMLLAVAIATIALRVTSR